MHKSFLDLISVLDTGLDEAEGGTHCVFYTLIILIDSLERIYEQKPKLVAELLVKHRFIRAEDWTISTSAMGYYFDDTITFIEEQLGMKEHEDYFVLYGTTLDYCVNYGIEEGEFEERFIELFPELSRYFDFIKVLRGEIVIRLKRDLDE
jgi:hypothetical protein